MLKTKINKKGAMALSQIMILLIGMVAISWAIGGGIGVVRADVGGGNICYDSQCVNECSSDSTFRIIKKCNNGDGKIGQCVENTQSKCGTGTTCKNGACVSDSSGKTEPTAEEPPAPGSETPQERNDEAPKLPTYESLGIKNPETKEYEEVDPNKPENKDKIINALEAGGLGYLNNKVWTAIDKKVGEPLLEKLGIKTPETGGKFGANAWGWFKGNNGWFKLQEGGFWQGAGTIAMALIAYSIVKAVTSNYMHERNARPVDTVAAWTAGGVSVWGIVSMFGVAGPPGWAALAIVLVAALVTGIITGQKFSQEIFSYIVSTWQPVDKGKWCEKCDELEFGCSEYQCHTFGKACGLVNPGTDYQKCVWKNEFDTTPPLISPVEGSLPTDLKYKEFNVTSPPDRGIRIIPRNNEKECIPAFTDLEIKVKTDEYAICMVDLERKQDMNQMTKFMGEGNYATLNHTLFIPSSATASSEQLENMGYVLEEGREHGFFIKCKDYNGNENPLHFLVEFCVDDGPDMNAPRITGMSKEDGDFIKFNETETPLTVYLNEPATCKWDFEDKDYDVMDYSLSDCSAKESFSSWCTGNLTGLKNNQENTYYIRCKDKPWWKEEDGGKQYANEESEGLTLKGTSSLYINKLTVNGEESGAKIKDSANPTKVKIEVTTSAGAEEGISTCSYLTGRSAWSEFSNGGTFEPSYKNFESFWLSAGTYKREIKCSDAAGNSDTAEINFTIETDREAPIIVRAFREGTSYIKVITDEEAECVYSLDNCNYEFDDGIEMMTNDNLEHFEDWNTNLEYSIKCKDEYGNQPEPNQCNMVVRASDF